jgi:hypothetical protein
LPVGTYALHTRLNRGDVTEDIAQAVLSKAQSERRSIGKAVQAFLERTLGVDALLSD